LDTVVFCWSKHQPDR